MRGQQALFTDLYSPLTVVPKAEGIGRNKALITARDKRMCYRYYFYQHIKRRSYPDIINLLSHQFDLSELRTIVCMSNNHTFLKKIINEEKPDVKALKNLYHWLNWD